MSIRLRTAGLGLVVGAVVALGAWAQQQGREGFNQVAGRASEDPAMVARGKTLYGINCQACHGSDLRGGDIGGPNLLRSSVAMTDKHGENIVPIIQGGRQAQGMPKIGISIEDSDAVAAYVRSVIGTIGGQGTPPGVAKELNIVVGDAAKGQVYFAAHCASCHAAEGDLRGVGTRYGSPRQMQSAWINGAPVRQEGGAPARPMDAAAASKPVETAPAVKPSATVTTADGQQVSGTLVRVDDFVVTLVLADGTRRSFRREGDVPKVETQDPAHAHRAMLPRYTDADIHDVTAYLVTLK